MFKLLLGILCLTFFISWLSPTFADDDDVQITKLKDLQFGVLDPAATLDAKVDENLCIYSDEEYEITASGPNSGGEVLYV